MRGVLRKYRGKVVLSLILSLVLISVVSAWGATSNDPLAQWQWKNPLPQGNSLQSVAFGVNGFVAVGGTGAIITSPDGSTWSSHKPTGNLNDLHAVTYGKKLFVAVGDNGTILTSPDGAIWTDVSAKVTWKSKTASNLNSVAYGNNLFYAVGDNGTILSSSDAATWTDVTNTAGLTSHNLHSVVYSNFTFVAVGENGTVLTLMNSGSWQVATSGTANALYSIASNRNLFVAVGAGGTVLSSADGITWTAGSSGTLTTLSGVAFGSNSFVAVGLTGTVVSSTDGLTWSPGVSGTTQNINGITYGGSGKFVAVGDNGVIMSAADPPVTWTQLMVSPTPTLRSVAYGSNVFVAVGDAGQVLYSADGNTWITKSSGSLVDLKMVVYGNGTFVVVGKSGVVLHSFDGATWFNGLAGTANLNGVVYDNRGPGQFVAIGDAGALFTSTDGSNWTPQIPPTTKNLNAITLGDNLLVAVGQGGAILTSADGITWASQSAGSKDFYAVTVAFSPSGIPAYVAVGAGGTIYSSSNATKWTTSKVPTAYKSTDFLGVACDFDSSFSTFVTVGAGGAILASPDAVNWTDRVRVTSNALNGISYINRSYWVVSSNGIVLNSNRLDNYIVVSATRKDTGAAISTDPIDFGYVDSGKSSFAYTIKITNTGQTTNLIVSGVSALDGLGVSSTEFLLSTPTCGSFPLTIAPGGSCGVDLTFLPGSLGGKTATLAIDSNDSAIPHLTRNVVGTGGLYIVVQPGPNGSVLQDSSSGAAVLAPVAVGVGDTPSFYMAPDLGYYTQEVIVDGVSLGPLPSYTFPAIAASGIPHLLQSYYSNAPHIITPTANTGGTVLPGTPVPVTDKSTQAFAIRPNLGYHLDTLKIDGKLTPATTLYTFPTVTANHTLDATFAVDSFTLTTAIETNGVADTKGTGGTITPGTVTAGNCNFSNSSGTCDYGSSFTYTITNKPGYRLSNVFVDGASVGAKTSWTFTGITGNHTLKAIFTNQYNVTVTYNGANPPNGTVSPTPNPLTGSVATSQGSNVTFTIKPNTGFVVQDVKLDGASNGGAPDGSTVTFSLSNVQTNHALDVTFAPTQYAINLSSSSGGSIQDDVGNAMGAQVLLPVNATKVFKLVPIDNYEVADVKVDGVSVGAVNTYVFTGIAKGHTLEVRFRGKPWVVSLEAAVNPTSTTIGTLDFTLTLPAGMSLPLNPVANAPLGQVDPNALKTVGVASGSKFSASIPPAAGVAAGTVRIVLASGSGFTPSAVSPQFLKLAFTSTTPPVFGATPITINQATDTNGTDLLGGTPKVTLTLDSPVAAPQSVATPAGGLYTKAQTVALTSIPSGANIHYTTTGADPTIASTIYKSDNSVPITISANTTLKYFAVDANGNQEPIRTSLYVIDKSLPTAVLAGLPPAVTNQTSALLNVGGQDVVAYKYLMDGGSYQTNEIPISTQISLTGLASGSHTLSVIGRDTAGNWQTAATKATWTVDVTLPATTFSPAAGLFHAPFTMTLANSKSTATIFYTLDGSVPTINSLVYTAPIPINQKTTVRFFAKDTAGNSEPPTTVQYDILALNIYPPLSPTTVNTPIITGTVVPAGAMVNLSISRGVSKNDGNWTSTPPASYTFTTAGGAFNVYGWVRDLEGNVISAPQAVSVAADVTPPNVTAFTLPASPYPALTVPISSFTDDGDVGGGGVTGYMVTETASAPSSGASGWSATPPATYTFATAGPKHLYAWAKDASGNVSPATAGVTDATITVTPDLAAPNVTAFVIPATYPSLTVPITTFTDDGDPGGSGVTGYLLTESASQPAAGTFGWSTTLPTIYTFASAGAKTLYAWVKDREGNVSAAFAGAPVTVSVDVTAPTVTGFAVTDPYSALTVPITTFTATDAGGVTGYLVTESSITPLPNDPGWSATAPATYTFSSAVVNPKTLYAWAKDASGNVSTSVTATVMISPDVTPPAITAFTMPVAYPSLTVPVTTFTASDLGGSGVSGYLLTESTATPAAVVVKGNNWSYDLSQPGASVLADGLNTVTATVVSGSNTYSQTVYIRVGGATCTTPDGDIDRDGQVTMADVDLAMRMAIGLVPSTAAALSCGDVFPVDGSLSPTLDGVVDVRDALLILQKVMGLTSFKP